MIFYLVTKEANYTMDQYMRSWGSSPGSRMQIVLYEDLPRLRILEPGTYIFSDLERLSPPRLKIACEVWKALSEGGARVRLLNDPSRVLCRYDLLRKLFDDGKNCFKAIRASESLASLHYPVFVREENQHNGSLTAKIYNQSELVREVRSLRLQGYRRQNLLVVEFCDTSDSAGVFRKYSAFIIGGEILPRHVIFSCHWDVKKPDLLDPHLDREQEDYLRTNPHKSWLTETFNLSGIEYGRIDYSLMGNKPQVWEINTNPTVRQLTPRLTAAFEAIDCQIPSGANMPIMIKQKLAKAMATEERRQRHALLIQKVARKLASYQLMKPVDPVMKSLIRFLSP